MAEIAVFRIFIWFYSEFVQTDSMLFKEYDVATLEF